MSEEDELYIIDEASLYVSKKKYPDGASSTRERIISKKAKKFPTLGHMWLKKTVRRNRE